MALKHDLGSLLWARVAIAALGFLTHVVNRRLLGPPLMGMWNYLEVVSTQVSAVSLGIPSSAERMMPILRGRGQAKEEQDLRSLMLSYMVLEGAVLGLLFLVYWFLRRADFEPVLRNGLLIVPLLLILGRVLTFYRMVMPNVKAFQTFASASVLLCLVNLLTIAYILLGGLYGVFVGLVANAALSIGICWFLTRDQPWSRVRWRFSLREVWALLPVGIPMAIYGFVSSLMERIDALMVSSFMGTTALGFYYFGPQLAMSISNFPKTLAHIAYPNFLEAYGQKGIAGLLPKADHYMRISMYLLVPVMVSSAYFVTEIVIATLLPRFEPGLAAIQVSILAVIFWQADFLATQILLVAGRVWLVVALTTVATVLLALLLLGIFWWQLPLVAVAWAVVVSRFFDAGVMMLAAYRTMAGRALPHARVWGSILGCGLLWTGLIVWIGRSVSLPELSPPAVSLAAAFVVREGVFLACLAAVMLLFQRPLLERAWAHCLSVVPVGVLAWAQRSGRR